MDKSPQNHHRRKPSQPRHLQQFLEERRLADDIFDSADVMDDMNVEEEKPLNLQVQRLNPPKSLLLQAPRLEGIVVSVSELSADLMLARQSMPPGTPDYHVRDALGHLAAARYRLMDALSCLQNLELPNFNRVAFDTARSQDTERTPPGVFQKQIGEKLNSESSDTMCASPTQPQDQQVQRVGSGAKRRWNKDMVDQSFVPQLSSDGSSVVLSKGHPVAALPVSVYQRLLEESRGAATLHLRALLKHFFPRDVLAESSVTGEGTYKRALDSDIVQGVCDYIHSRYPGAMTDSRMRLCCTDVCVQARRRRTTKPNSSAGPGVQNQPAASAHGELSSLVHVDPAAVAAAELNATMTTTASGACQSTYLF